VEGRGYQIIVVEDSRADFHIIQESLRQSGLNCQITAFSDGAAAILHVTRGDGQVPDLVILDLNVPEADGASVLNAVRGNTRWAHVPVFVFTASLSPADVARVKMLGGDRYLIKPMDLAGFEKFGREIREWLEQNALRTHETSGSSPPGT